MKTATQPDKSNDPFVELVLKTLDKNLAVAILDTENAKNGNGAS